MKKLTIILILLLTVGNAWGATDYYTTNSGSGCTDDWGVNSCGTTSSLPKEWSDDATAAGWMETHDQAGKHWYFERGYTYKMYKAAHPAYLITLGGNGSGWDDEDNYYSIDAWGSGDKPIFDGSRDITSDTANSWAESFNGGSNPNRYSLDISDIATDATSNYELVLEDGSPLREEANAGAVDANGEFYADVAGEVLYLQTTDGTSPSTKTITYSPCDAATFLTSSSYKKISNINFKYNGGSTAALYINSTPIIIDDCEFGYNLTGIQLVGADSQITDTYFHDNWNGDRHTQGGSGEAIELGGGTGHLIARNTFYNNFRGIYLNTDSSGKIQFNLFRESKTANFLSGPGDTGFINDHLIIQNNTFYHKPADSADVFPSGIVGESISLSTSQQYLTIRNNISVVDVPETGVITGKEYDVKAYSVGSITDNVTETNNCFYSLQHTYNSRTAFTADNKVGIITDLHYHSSTYPTRLTDAENIIDKLENTENVDATMLLGDMVYDPVSGADSTAQITAVGAILASNTYWTPGNVDMTNTTIGDLLTDASTWMSDQNFTFDVGSNWRFICFDNGSGTDDDTVNWLGTAIDAGTSANKYMVLASHIDIASVAAYNGAAIRTVVETKINAGAEIKLHIHGHSHTSEVETVNGIPYYGISNVDDNIGGEYAVLELDDSGNHNLVRTYTQGDYTFNPQLSASYTVSNASSCINAGTDAGTASLNGIQTDAFNNTYDFTPYDRLNIGADQRYSDADLRPTNVGVIYKGDF
jgi:hypothetical protein